MCPSTESSDEIPKYRYMALDSPSKLPAFTPYHVQHTSPNRSSDGTCAVVLSPASFGLRDGCHKAFGAKSAVQPSLVSKDPRPQQSFRQSQKDDTLRDWAAANMPSTAFSFAAFRRCLTQRPKQQRCSNGQTTAWCLTGLPREPGVRNQLIPSRKASGHQTGVKYYTS